MVKYLSGMGFSLFGFVLVLSGVLLAAVLIYMRKVLSRLIRGRAGPVVVSASPRPAGHLMGKVRLEPGVEELSFSGFSFAQGAGQTGLVADVIAELKVVFLTLAEQDGKKVDFLRMMVGLEERYVELAGHPGLMEVRRFISLHAPFALSVEELTGFWDLGD